MHRCVRALLALDRWLRLSVALLWAVSRLRLSLAPLTITVDAHWSSTSAAALSWTSALDFDLEVRAVLACCLSR